MRIVLRSITSAAYPLYIGAKMRLKLISLFCAAAYIVAPVHAAPRPALSKETLFSVDQIADLDAENGDEDDHALYGAAQTLVETFSPNGIVFTDNSLHKDWPMTAGDAKILLVSIYESMAMQANGAIDALLYEKSKDEAAPITAAAVKAFEQATNPLSACRILIDTQFAVPSKKAKLKPLADTAIVTWDQAVACFPGAAAAPVSMMAYDRKPAARGKAITRGEFVHKLNAAAEKGIFNFSSAIYD